jgi:hypothetical protein
MDMMFIISWYIGLSIFAVSLILLRDDADLLYNDIKESFKDGLFYGCCFILAFVFYSPMTLPYSINYFIQKWK